MTKAEIVANISEKSGIEKADVLRVVEDFMKEVKGSLEKDENVYVRGFGSFIIKKRAEKTGRNISKTQLLKFQHIISLHLNRQRYLLKVLRRR